MTALVYENLLAAIGAAPALPGARCKNRAHLFDPAAPGENPDTVSARHNHAVGLCEHCPSLTRCEAWVSGLKPSQRPLGVVAGQINRGPEERERRPPGRPRKAVS
jgi:WhiB family redox-sensing transcriptional regulator